MVLICRYVVNLKSLTLQSFHVKVKEISAKLHNLMRIPPVSILLTIGFLDALAVQSSALLLQFASKRLGWSLGRSACLLSIRAAVALLLTLGLLPGLTLLLNRKLQLHPFQADVLILRISFISMIIGYCLIASSFSSWLLILGTFKILLGEPSQSINELPFQNLIASLSEAHSVWFRQLHTHRRL